MDRNTVLAFLRARDHAVEASNGPSGTPQAAVIGYAVTDDLELVFDTLDTTRKCQNLRRDPRVALVVGWEVAEAQTLQLEGVADEPTGDDHARLLAAYLARFPEGAARQEWPGITLFRVRPTWARLSDFRTDPPTIAELAL